MPQPKTTITIAVLPFVAKILARELAAHPLIKEGTIIGGALQHLPFCYAPDLFTAGEPPELSMAPDIIQHKRSAILTLHISEDIARYYYRWKAVNMRQLPVFFAAQARDRIYFYLDAAQDLGISKNKALQVFYAKYGIDEDELPQDSLIRAYDRRKAALKNT